MLSNTQLLPEPHPRPHPELESSLFAHWLCNFGSLDPTALMYLRIAPTWMILLSHDKPSCHLQLLLLTPRLLFAPLTSKSHRDHPNVSVPQLCQTFSYTSLGRVQRSLPAITPPCLSQSSIAVKRHLTMATLTKGSIKLGLAHSCRG